MRRVCAAKAALERADRARPRRRASRAIGHEDRLEHVIGHLVQNALDATANGGSVSVRLHRDGRFAADRSRRHRRRHDAGVRPRAAVQAVRDDQGDGHGHRRLRKLAVRRRARRADPGRQHAQAWARACACCCRSADSRCRAPRAAEGSPHDRNAQAAADRRGRSGAAEADQLGVRPVRDGRRRAIANRRSRSCAATSRRS